LIIVPLIIKNNCNLVKIIVEDIDKILFEYTKLYGARFVVFEEEKIGEDKTKRNYIEISDLLKLLLGKRLESGVYPFETTLRRIRSKEEIFYDIFKNRIDNISNNDDLIDTIKEAVDRSKVKKELEEINEEYIDLEYEETWFDRVIELLIGYAKDSEEYNEKYSHLDLLKIGIRTALVHLENDLRIINNILESLNNLKRFENGIFKSVSKIPVKKDEVIELPIFFYDDPN